MKILIIILEGSSASGICVENISKELIKRGIQVDILTYSNSKINSINSIKNYEVKPKLFLKRKKFRNFYSFQCAVSSIFMWPWNSPYFTFKLFWLVKSLYKKKQYDMIIPCYTQIDPLIASCMVKKIFPSVIVIPYFIDSLSGGPTPKLLSKNKKIKKGLFWENVLLKNVDSIVMMKSSEEHQKKYSSKKVYFNKIKFLDIPMLIKPNNITYFKVKYKKTINAVYVGSMPLSIRTPYYGLNLLKEHKNIDIQIIGDVPNNYSYKNFCKQAKSIHLIGSVSHSKAMQYISKAEVLINFGNKIAEMVPSKIFEYMSYGKPIISFAPNKNDPSVEYLKRYPKACIIFEKDEYDKNKIKLNNFLNNLNEKNIAFDQVEKIFYRNTPKAFCDYILKVGQKKND
ncbi:hypothetical protein H6A03_04245 [[Clostridium] spiroforme]|nr:hypothetical protein [Thomasclavelia spiroformis]